MNFSWKKGIFICVALANVTLCNALTSTVILKESFGEILRELPEMDTMPFIGNQWDENDKKTRVFGGSSIEKELFNFIRAVLPAGKILLELGSGWVSGQLDKYYTLYSIENNEYWLDKYGTNYIYSPLKNGWYDIDILKEKMPKYYDLILVDGPIGDPSGKHGRRGFLTNIHLFNTDLPIIFDDVNRKPEYEIMIQVAQKLQRDVAVFKGNRKSFGIILLN